VGPPTRVVPGTAIGAAPQATPVPSPAH
jgi:hypothetical protein